MADEFDAHNGWYFKRVENGAVQVTHDDGNEWAQVTLDAEAWCQAVAAVSVTDDLDGGATRRAMELHDARVVSDLGEVSED